jgi:hypothetical protein
MNIIIRLAVMTNVQTSPFFSQSNGKLERYHTLKAECIRPRVALSLEEARTQIADYIQHYNDERYTAPLVTSHPRTNVRAAINRFLQNAIKNSRPPERPENKND